MTLCGLTLEQKNRAFPGVVSLAVFQQSRVYPAVQQAQFHRPIEDSVRFGEKTPSEAVPEELLETMRTLLAVLSPALDEKTRSGLFLLKRRPPTLVQVSQDIRAIRTALEGVSETSDRTQRDVAALLSGQKGEGRRNRDALARVFRELTDLISGHSEQITAHADAGQAEILAQLSKVRGGQEETTANVAQIFDMLQLILEHLLQERGMGTRSGSAFGAPETYRLSDLLAGLAEKQREAAKALVIPARPRGMNRGDYQRLSSQLRHLTQEQVRLAVMIEGTTNRKTREGFETEFEKVTERMRQIRTQLSPNAQIRKKPTPFFTRTEKKAGGIVALLLSAIFAFETLPLTVIQKTGISASTAHNLRGLAPLEYVFIGGYSHFLDILDQLLSPDGDTKVTLTGNPGEYHIKTAWTEKTIQLQAVTKKDLQSSDTPTAKCDPTQDKDCVITGRVINNHGNTEFLFAVYPPETSLLNPGKGSIVILDSGDIRVGFTLKNSDPKTVYNNWNQGFTETFDGYPVLANIYRQSVPA